MAVPFFLDTDIYLKQKVQPFVDLKPRIFQCEKLLTLESLIISLQEDLLIRESCSFFSDLVLLRFDWIAPARAFTALDKWSKSLRATSFFFDGGWEFELSSWLRRAWLLRQWGGERRSLLHHGCFSRWWRWKRNKRENSGRNGWVSIGTERSRASFCERTFWERGKLFSKLEWKLRLKERKKERTWGEEIFGMRAIEARGKHVRGSRESRIVSTGTVCWYEPV